MPPKNGGMDPSCFSTDGQLQDHRGQRRHRFMESSDINAAFRELFQPLRANIRRGLTIAGEFYGFEMDGCIPGQLLGGSWIPAVSRGIDDAAVLADPARRRAVFAQLLQEDRNEALYAFVTECKARATPATLYVEVVSADGCYAAEHLLRPGRGWHVRDLVQAPARRVALA
jgi:hypothetical protein